MKKLINKIGIITFSFSPIITTALAPSSSTTSVSSQFRLSQSFQTKLKKSFKNSKWVEQTQTNSGSNITQGQRGVIFEDSRGNLWSMGYLTPLQKYNYTTNRWTTETSDTKNSSGSNINDGSGGTIFEDSRGNLWSMGNGTPLQKYNYTTKQWIAETNNIIKSSGSNIFDGWGGNIFEDSRGNLWSMGNGTPLQKYNYTTKKWTAETNIGEGNSGSNITDGHGGTIFEDSHGNLWSMGFKTPLQKYNYTTNRWTTETSDTKNSSGSNITQGPRGIIFEDSRGNLWSMGHGTPLQKYDYQTKRWTAETNIGEGNSGSNITDGWEGTIFEDSRGNLWSMGNFTPLQKYSYTTKEWTRETNENSGSNINSGRGGTIFEDSSGNLWSMGNGTPLQKYDYQTKRWTVEKSSGSNITDSFSGTIFEDSRGNLWSMGGSTKLQKLMPTKITDSANQPTKDYKLIFRTKIISNSKISLSIQGLRKHKSNLFSHLEYKKKTESEWKVVKNKILFLDRANYNFRWVLGTEEILASGQKIPQEIIIKSDGSIKTFFKPGDIAKVKVFLNALANNAISSLANNAKLVSAVTKSEVLALIQAASGYSTLSKNQQAIISEDLISLSEDPARTLKVTITFEDENYELTKDGFKLNLQVEANKFQDFTSTDNTKSNVATLKSSSKDVFSIFKKISGYQRPANLASDISITKVTVKNALNPQTRKVTFELTIAHQDEAVKKDVNVTFQVSKIIPKTSQKESNKKGLFGLSTGKIVGIGIGSVFGIGIIGFLIFRRVGRNKK